MPDPTYYQATVGPLDAANVLQQSEHAQICIIGGGFAGLATALGLVERGIKNIVLLEKHHIGYGASGRNGGFVFGGYSLPETELIRQQGAARARQLYQLTTEAVTLIKQRVQRYAIDCDLNPAGVLWADWFGDRQMLLNKQRLLREQLGAEWTFIPREDVREQLATERYFDALLETQAAHFHPLKYALGVARVLRNHAVKIYTDSPASHIRRDASGFTVTTDGGEIKAEQVVVAAGGYIHGLKVSMAKAILPIATYVMATEPLGETLASLIKRPWAIYDTRFAFDYYRPLPDTRLLWGGRISGRRREPHGLDEMLRADLRKVFPQLGQVKIDYAWQGLMGYPKHQMPMVAESEPGLWHVLGFGGHGVAPTTAMGELAAAAIADGDQRYRWLQRYQLRSVWGDLGRSAAQLSYWYLQSRDALKDFYWRNRR